MELESIKKIYNGYASVYDLLFKGFFHPRQKLALNSLDIKEGDRVLDVGVGTGLTLPLYPRNCEVWGVDISVDMLKQARKKVERMGLDNVHIMEMDACDLQFDDDFFDFVVATHIISVVPEPYRVIAEMRRVGKPDGKLVIVNHFVSSNPVIAKVENICDPLFRKLGWRMDMTLEDLITETDLRVYKTDKLSKIDLWKIVHARNNKSPACGAGN
ncbi:MAG: class I SAM-dependent methyltransferase [Candidatus Nitrospinota bacterium M3_3B_026]